MVSDTHSTGRSEVQPDQPPSECPGLKPENHGLGRKAGVRQHRLTPLPSDPVLPPPGPPAAQAAWRAKLEELLDAASGGRDGATPGGGARAARALPGGALSQGPSADGPRFLPIDFCLRIVPRGRPRNGPFGLPGTVGVITAMPWRSYTDCKPEAAQVRGARPASPAAAARGAGKLGRGRLSRDFPATRVSS